MMAGAIAVGSPGRIRNKLGVVHLGLVVLGAVSLLCGMLPRNMTGFWVFAGLCLAMGASANLYSIPYVAYLQESIPREAHGRAFSLMGSLMSVTMPLGMLIARPVAERYGDSGADRNGAERGRNTGRATRFSERGSQMIIRKETAGDFSETYDLVKTAFETGEYADYDALQLAPLSVALEHRRRGIGAALVNDGFGLARQMGYSAAFLIGDPAYYERSGFRPSVTFGIRHTRDIPDENVMACELVPGALEGIRGTISCV